MSKKDKQNILDLLVIHNDTIGKNIKKSRHFEKIFLIKNISDKLSLNDLQNYANSKASSSDFKTKFLKLTPNQKINEMLIYLPLQQIIEIKEYFNIHIPLLPK